MSAPRYPRLYVIDFDTDGPLIAAYFTQSPEGDSGCAPIAEYVHVSEVTRLRAALAEIAALQPTEPFSANFATTLGCERAVGEWVASEAARAALVKS